MADYSSYNAYRVAKIRRENKKNKPKRKWVPPEQYYGEKAWENILFFTKGQEAVDKWRKEKAEREVIND
jgi:hypothetical protein